MSDPLPEPRRVVLPDPLPAGAARLDRALALVLEDAGLSRSRLRALIEAGALSGLDGVTVRDPARKVKPGEAFVLDLPQPRPAAPQPEAIALSIVHEDADLIVIDKPAGMVVHPAPGAASGTLVNALLYHCGAGLTGIGGVERPGIVHRIDKDTSGLIVVAKTEAAHRGLSALFAAHDITRAYLAVVWGEPSRADPRLSGVPGLVHEPGWTRIATGIDRHRTDRTRMAVAAGGRGAVTRFRLAEAFGRAALLECRLETGRTHQIRVHLTHAGHPLVGDAVYGRPRTLPPGPMAEALRGFPRQALHAARLGFVHPVRGVTLDFVAPLPPDMDHLVVTLRRCARDHAYT